MDQEVIIFVAIDTDGQYVANEDREILQIYINDELNGIYEIFTVKVKIPTPEEKVISADMIEKQKKYIEIYCNKETS